jgi:hypothetical protein
VIGDADRGLPVGDRGTDDVADARRAVEHRVLGVQMQVNEGLRHQMLAVTQLRDPQGWGQPCGRITYVSFEP